MSVDTGNSPPAAATPDEPRPADPRFTPWITAPGVYDDIPDDEYHADPVVGGSLSSTTAREILRAGGPARVAYYREHGRPDRVHFDVGRAAHTEALGVGAPIVVVPVARRQGKVWDEAERKARAAGATPLPEPDADKVFGMAEALRGHPVVGKMLQRPGWTERTVVARDPETGVMCRVRIDKLLPGAHGRGAVIVDLKTTGRDAGPEAFARAMGDHGYHQQGAFYGDALDANGLVPDGWQFVMVTVEKDPPHLVAYSFPDEAAIEWGRRLNRRSRWLYRLCELTGQWPGHSLEPSPLALPYWQERQYEAEDVAGGRLDVTDLVEQVTAAEAAQHRRESAGD